MIRRVLLSAALLGAAGFTGCQEHHEGHAAEQGLSSRTKDGRLSPELKNLGRYHRAVTTASAEAQKFFDQGLILTYGFNHAEAVRSFREAQRLDPECGMAYWGEALALAPNINDPAIGPDREQQGYQAIKKALERKSGALPVEAALIDAMARRYDGAEKPDRERLNRTYAEAMKAAYAAHPADPDVAVLYADAVMNTMPWDYWSRDGKPRTGIPEIVEALQAVIARTPDHPGANHIFIHAVEASPDPDRAVASADRLGGLVPGAGHLVHMPAHIYIRVGRYGDAVDANVRAIAADEDYITQCRAQGIYPAAYYPHNIHFLFAALSMSGRSRETMDAARKVASKHSHADMQQPGFGFAHLLKATPLLAMVRFGKWDEALAEPDPGESMRFVQAVRHYARGLAYLRKGDPAAAEKELAGLRAAAAGPALAGLKILEMNDLATVARIPENLLAAEIAAARQDLPSALRLAQKAVETDDGLKYSEPPDWPLPPRQTLGAILLQAGRAREAERVFRADLARHRDNGWSLRGLTASLRAQGRHSEAMAAEERFRKAWSQADIRTESARL